MALRRPLTAVEQSGLDFANPVAAQPPGPSQASLRRPLPPPPTRLSEITDEELEATRQARAVAATSETEKAINLGAAGVQSGVYASRGLARNLAFGDGSGDIDLMKAQNIQEEAARAGPRIQQIEQVEGVGDALEYARNMVAQQVPNLLLTAGTGGVAGLARATGGGLARRYAVNRLANQATSQVGSTVSREARRAAVEQARKQVKSNVTAESVNRAVVAGTVASSTALQAGQMTDAALDDTTGKSSRERAAIAATGAAVTGALEALPVVALLRRFGLAPAEQAAKAVATGRLAARVAKQAGAQAGIESTTELAQTFGELATHKLVNDDVELFDDDARSAYINAAIGGAIGGAVFGAPAGIKSGKDNLRVTEGLREGYNSLREKMAGFGSRVGEEMGVVADSPTARKVRDTVQPMVDQLRPQVEEAVGQAREAGAAAVSKIRETYARVLGEQQDETRFNSIMATVDGKPYDFSVIDGEAVITGAPLNTFVDKARAQTFKESLGLDSNTAMFASAIEDDARVSQLAETGALSAAHKAFTGWDIGKFSPEEHAGLNQYLEALPDQKANQFLRTLATFEAMSKRGVLERNDDGSLAEAYIYQPESAGPLATSSESADTQQRAAEQAERSAAGINEAPAEELRINAGKALRGAPVRGATTGNITMVDDKGARRQANLYGAITELRKDPAFVASMRDLSPDQRTEATVAAALSVAAENGYQIDVDSIRPGVKLAADDSWTLTPVQAARLRAGFGDPEAQAQLAARAEPIAPRARAVDDEQGQADRSLADRGRVPLQTERGTRGPAVEETPLAERQGVATGVEESVLERRVPVLPGQGSPDATTTRTLDSGTVDRAAQRAEARPSNDVADNLQRLDRLIEARTSTKPTSKTRSSQIGQLRQELKGQALAQLNRRVLSLAEADVRRREVNLRQARAEVRKAFAKRKEGSGTEAQLKQAQDAFDKVERGLKTAKQRVEAERARIKQAPSKFAPAKKTVTKVATAKAPTLGNVLTAAPAASARFGALRANSLTAEFAASLQKLLVNEPGLERFTTALEKVRTRIGLMAMREALPSLKGVDLRVLAQADALVSDRLSTLNEKVSEAGNASFIRGDERYRALSPTEYAKQRDQLAAAADGDKSLSSVLKKMLPHMNKGQKLLVQQMLDSKALNKTAYFFETSLTSHEAFYSDFDNSVTQTEMVLPRGSQLLSPIDSLLHEATHAATIYAERVDAVARKDLNALLNHVRDQYKLLGGNVDSWYGLSDTQEFLAEAFSNPRFQEVLASIPALDTKTYKNAWEQFKGWIRSALKLGDKEITALDEVLTIGGILMREQGVLRAENVNRIRAGQSFNAYNSARAAQPVDWVTSMPPDARAYLTTAFENRAIRERIAAALPPEVRHTVYAADIGPSVLINIGTAMALEGRLTLDPEGRGFVRLLWDRLSEALRIPNANVYARQLLRDIQSGHYNGRGYNIAERTIVKDPGDVFGKNMLKAQRWINDKVVPVYDGLLKNMNTRIRNTGVPAMREFATLIAQRTGEFRANQETSYRQNWEQARGEFLNRLGRIISGINEDNRKALTKALQTQERPDNELGPVYDQVREYMDDMYDYSQEKGFRFAKTDNFFPVAVDEVKIAANKDAFFELHRAKNFDKPIRDRFKRWTRDKLREIVPDADGNYTRTQELERDRLDAVLRGIDKRPIDELIGELYDMALFGGREHYIAGVNFANPHHRPAFSNAKHRTSDFIFRYGTPEQKAEFAKFQTDDLAGVLVSYTNRITRRAEWESMELSPRIKALLDTARTQGATAKDIVMMQDYLNMEMGTYNDSWNPFVKRILQSFDRVFATRLAETDFQKFKALQGVLVAYNNVRLLPLALVSSFVDPLGPMVRSGTVKDSFTNLRDAFRALRNESGDDELRAMADTLGLIEREEMGDIMAHLYGNIYDPSSTAAKVNNTLFKFNGLNGMTRLTRLTALAAAHRFLIRHKTSPNEHSERYFRELGLKPEDITVAENGRFVEIDSEDIQLALRRFVDEATVRPYPGQKPSWHNDPNFTLAAQYKGYLYAFYENIILRAYNEGWVHGNPAVFVPIMLYIPVTMAAEMARDAAQGDGEDKEMDDYLVQSLDRSGLMGARYGVVTDVKKNAQYGSAVLGNVAGPTGQQIGDAYDAVISGQGDADEFVVEALPGQALYKEWGS